MGGRARIQDIQPAVVNTEDSQMSRDSCKKMEEKKLNICALYCGLLPRVWQDVYNI
jgi:hypothetical protein